MSLPLSPWLLDDRVDAPICQDCRGGTLGGIEVCCAQPVIIDERVVDLSSDESLKATDNVFRFLTKMYARFWNDLADHASASR